MQTLTLGAIEMVKEQLGNLSNALYDYDCATGVDRVKEATEEKEDAIRDVLAAWHRFELHLLGLTGE